VVLAAVGERLRRLARAGDLVARIGGEEFAVLLPEARMAEARTAAERLCQSVRSQRGPVPMTISVGVASGSGDGLSGADLLALADEALYEAKQNGRDQVAAARIRTAGHAAH
jgi:two-component system cell cycle response regulator